MDERTKAIKQARAVAIRARKQRNATTNNQDFDYWHGVMMESEERLANLLLKTGDIK